MDQYRPSPWPAVVLPVGDVNPWPCDLVKTDAVVGDHLVLRLGEPGAPQPIPEEWILRELFDVEIEDAECIADVVRNYGLPMPFDGGSWGENASPFDLLPHPAPLELVNTWRSAQSWAASQPSYPGSVVSVSLVAHHLKVLRTLARHWIAHILGRDDEICDAWRAEGLEVPESEFAAWTAFTNHLNRALRPTHAFVFVPPVAQITYWPYRPLHTVAASQLYNLIVENAEVRQCGNESCRQFFHRQLGRASAGQNRTVGVRFCRPTCAKTQVQREARRRARDARASAGSE